MGIKYCKEAKEYTVSYHRRHPQTKRSCNLRRKGIKTKVEAEKVYKQLIVELTQKFYEAQHPLWIEVVGVLSSLYKSRDGQEYYIKLSRKLKTPYL